LRGRAHRDRLPRPQARRPRPGCAAARPARARGAVLLRADRRGLVGHHRPGGHPVRPARHLHRLDLRGDPGRRRAAARGGADEAAQPAETGSTPRRPAGRTPVSTLHDLTTTEFAALSPRPRVALIPVGATEQHGPNLAMGVDWRIAEAIARRVAATLSPTAVATPALPFGLSGHHMDFPGTISIGADAFRAVLTDV